MLYCEILATVGPLSLTQIHIVMAAARISQKLPGLLCIKRKETILCCNLVPEEMRLQLTNSGFYDKGKLSVYDKVAKSTEARQQLSKCGNSFDIEEEAVEELF